MKIRLILRALTAVMFALTVVVALPAHADKAGSKSKARKIDDAGRRVFLSSGCAGCHGVAKKGIAKATPKIVKGGPDLSAVGKTWRAKRLRAWLQQKLVRKGNKHPLKFGGSRTQLDAVVAWLRR